jgi:hypothetical protein
VRDGGRGVYVCKRETHIGVCRCIDDAWCTWQAAAQHQDFGTKIASSGVYGQLDSSKPTKCVSACLSASGGPFGLGSSRS